MKRVPKYILPLAFSALATIQSTPYAAVDMFLKISDIKGESMDKSHQGEIEVLAWSWDLSQSSDPNNPIVRPMSVTKYVDLSTPVLYDYLLTNKMAPEAVLTVRKAGSIPIEYVIITMTGVTVTTASPSGDGGMEQLQENISLNFSSACVKYTPQSNDGSAGIPIETCWTFDDGAK